MDLSSNTIQNTPPSITIDNFPIKKTKNPIRLFTLNTLNNFMKTFLDPHYNTTSSTLDDTRILPRRTKLRKRPHRYFIRHLFISDISPITTNDDYLHQTKQLKAYHLNLIQQNLSIITIDIQKKRLKDI